MFKSLAMSAALVLAASGAVSAGDQSAHPSSAQYEKGATAGEDSTNAEQRRRYEEGVKQQLSEWTHKVETYYEEAKREGSDTVNAAEERLTEAWDDVKVRWEALQEASGAAWQKSRKAFQKAWQEFENTWSEVTSEQE